MRILTTTFILFILFGCSKKEIVPERFYPRNDHQAYWYSLKQANLLTTALGKDWVNAAENALTEQIDVKLPYQEAFVLSETIPEAITYRFDVKRGQKILVDVEAITTDTTKVFVDLYRIENDSLNQFIQVASADSTLQLAFQPRRDAVYLLRLQPELLRGGNFTVTIENIPSLAFPVVGKNKRAIQSFFGDPRDGGRREHHGVDIFAKRHTPIIAPVKADVRFAGTRGIGGRVVWLYDRKTGNHLYFAHLHDIKVKRYQRVNPGDTIGTVGNTGNARFTPPHLHFGIYKNGPMNPYAFIVPENEVQLGEADTLALGKQITSSRTLFIKSEMSRRANPIDTVEVGEAVTISAINHRYIRVTTPSGEMGFLRKGEISRL